MASLHKIRPCLWFDNQAEEAANFYVGIFKNARITKTTHFSEVGQEIHQHPAGSVMTVDFDLDGVSFTALNGGPMFTFTEAISLQVDCADQAEVDYFWEKLGEGGDPAGRQCGWLKDKYGISWQIVPSILPELVEDPESEASRRAMEAMLKMEKLDIA